MKWNKIDAYFQKSAGDILEVKGDILPVISKTVRKDIMISPIYAKLREGYFNTELKSILNKKNHDQFGYVSDINAAYSQYFNPSLEGMYGWYTEYWKRKDF